MNDPIGQATWNLISAANELSRLLATERCPSCGGEGRIVLDFPIGNPPSYIRPCRQCNETGTLPRSHSEPEEFPYGEFQNGKQWTEGGYEEQDDPPEWDEALEAYYQHLGAKLGARVRSHSDLDIELRQNSKTRCPSCGGQTGTYDGQGQWYVCGVCHGLGYREGVVR